MGTSHSIDLVELNALIEDRGVSTWLSWRMSPREPRVGYGFGDLPVRSVAMPPGTSTSMLGGTRRIVDDGQATIEGGGGFRGGQAARVRISTRSGSDYDVFRVTSTVKPDEQILFTDLTTVAEVAERIVEFHHRCVDEFDQHAAWAADQITESHATLDSMLGAMFDGNTLGL